MQITDLTPQKNNPKRVNLFIDGKFALGLDLDTVVRAGLRVGQILTDEEWQKISEEVTKTSLYNNALNFLSFRPRSEKEVKDHLLIKTAQKHKKESKISKISQSVLEEIIAKLKKMGLIDDEKFCLWWIEQRQNFRPGGKRLLKLELLKKGVRHELVNQVLDSLAFDSREKENCLKLAEKWQLKHKACLSVLEDKQRIFRYLAGRGFNFETIEDVIDTLAKKE